MQFSRLGHQQFQGRQLSSGHVQHGIGQSHLNQGNQINRLGQLSDVANSALFSGSQTTPNTQMIPNISATMPSQSLLPWMQSLAAYDIMVTHSAMLYSLVWIIWQQSPGESFFPNFE
ncbi:mediator of RNA polymerase II transcription subunit 8 [Quillaja saponaria]|uniref:Mediator of RNA polymerase II transcription subunit 8 n=1 Tax=Quillaja saponaria TaxID=32244 RepID=A0AAD7L6D6_QUISA|nr:mediator of RNA polymerase II transcription subunit 8 [Quillaja saponaria]